MSYLFAYYSLYILSLQSCLSQLKKENTKGNITINELKTIKRFYQQHSSKRPGDLKLKKNMFQNSSIKTQQANKTFSSGAKRSTPPAGAYLFHPGLPFFSTHPPHLEAIKELRGLFNKTLTIILFQSIIHNTFQHNANILIAQLQQVKNVVQEFQLYILPQVQCGKSAN